MKRVHRMCEYLKQHDAFTKGEDMRAVKCLRCPAWEPIEHYGKGKRGCRALAEDPFRIVIWGTVGGWRRHRYLAIRWLRRLFLRSTAKGSTRAAEDKT